MATVEASVEKPQSWLDRLLAQGVRVDAETAAYAAVVLLAIATRFYDVGARVMSHDETTHVKFSWDLFQGLGFRHNPLMHGPLQFHLVALSYFLFGDNDVAAHIPAALAGVAAVGMLWLFRRWLGRVGALTAAALMLASPYMLFYSRYVRNEAFVVVEGLLMFWAVFRYAETRRARWLYLLAASLSLHFATKETAYIYAAELLLFLGGYFVWDVLGARWEKAWQRRAFVAGVLAALAGAGAAGYRFLHDVVAATKTGAEAAAALEGPATGGWVHSPFLYPVALGLTGLGVALVLAALLAAFGRRLRSEFASLDLLVVSGTLILPQLMAFALPIGPMVTYGRTDNPADLFTPEVMQRLALVAPLFILVSLAIGLAWDWRRWLVAAGLFLGLYVPVYTTLFTNALGLGTGAVGSLAYWLGQQGVQRGTQPWYYFVLLQVPTYEYLPALGSLLALGYGLRAAWRTPAPAEAPTQAADLGTARPTAFPVIGFIGYWALASVVAFSAAGEKMPWLTVHIALPMILLAGWAIGRFLCSIDWGRLRSGRGWLLALLLALLLLAVFRAAGILLGPQPPFQGTELDQLEPTVLFLTAVVVAAAAAIGLARAARGWRPAHLAGLVGVMVLGVLYGLTARTAFRAAYVNYDEATEFLVYAHGAPGSRLIMQQIEDLSRRTTDGLGLSVAYDDQTLYPFWWYLRNYKNAHSFGAAPTRELLNDPVVIAGAGNWAKVEAILGRRYYSFEYVRLWWPMQDYIGLTWPRIAYALSSPAYRAALWDIWLNRDYTAYGKLTGADFSLKNWQPADRMKLYIRKDVAALVWDYGVAAGALEPATVQDPYAKGMVQLPAAAVIGTQGAGPGQFTAPRGLAVAPDGSLYVADTGNHRIQHLAPDGTLLQAWGEFADVAKGPAPGGTFNEPWGVAVAPDGTVYVADTWNHRIQHFTAEGKFLGMFGTFGQAETRTAFWGPRAVAVDSTGRVFVADTGNKRVVVFGADGLPLDEFGGVGSGPGQLDEPVGLALDASGRVYVADTWNQRIQVFEAGANGGYTMTGSWPIDGWYGQSLDNKPYLAVSSGGTVCASDPEGYRILCFKADGTFLKGWGEYGSGPGAFGLPVGMTFAPDGKLWVVDSANARVMRFAPDLP